MKKILFLLCVAPILMLVSCTKLEDTPLQNRIINLETREGHILGKGVIYDAEHILTTSHVQRQCARSDCRYGSSVSNDSYLIQADQIIEKGDFSQISLQEKGQISSLSWSELDIGMPIYALVSRSGSWERIDGKIIALDASYIGYDESLSVRLFTGAIETDILLEKGESGTPIWSLSGALVGIMSARDDVGKRGWGVR